MIIGRISDISRYLGLHPNLDEAIKIIKTINFLDFPIGKHELRGTDIFLLREEYEPRKIEDCYFEGHEKYLDIQIVVSGKEGLGYAHVQALTITDDYNENKDVCKYSGKAETIYEMEAATFAIVFPEDIHMPKIKLEDSSFVKKAVLKVKL